MGVAEHSFNFHIHGKDVTWHLYDVAGARGQRHTWVPYFDDANAILFVAPVSALDQVRPGLKVIHLYSLIILF
jgi:guanine nucleotide-binding protein alpha-1 subunit